MHDASSNTGLHILVSGGSLQEVSLAMMRAFESALNDDAFSLELEIR